MKLNTRGLVFFRPPCRCVCGQKWKTRTMGKTCENDCPVTKQIKALPLVKIGGFAPKIWDLSSIDREITQIFTKCSNHLTNGGFCWCWQFLAKKWPVKQFFNNINFHCIVGIWSWSMVQRWYNNMNPQNKQKFEENWTQSNSNERALFHLPWWFDKRGHCALTQFHKKGAKSSYTCARTTSI